jgi:Outer membrane protein beta-barrel domain
MQMRSWITGAVAALAMTGAASAEDWSGFYAGVLGEASFIDLSEIGAVGAVGTPGIAKVVGYNWDMGDWVIGVDELFAYWRIGYEDEIISKLAWQKMVRVGYEITDNSLVYGAGGFGIFRLNYDGDIETYTYGALAFGIEVAMNENMAWRTHAQVSFPQDDLFDTNIYSVGTGVVWSFN